MKNRIKKEEVNKPGVYRINNLLNGKFYIGSSINLSYRFRSHLHTLKKNISDCRILQNAINKHGIENFEFIVVFVGDSYIDIENQLIKELKPQYNVLQDCIKKQMSEESKKLLSESQLERYRLKPAKKGYKRPNYIRTVRMGIRSIDKNGNIKEFVSAKEAAKYYNANLGAIYNAINYNQLLKWKYKIERI